VINLPDVKENYGHVLDFALRLSRLFDVNEFGLSIQTPLYGSSFLP
jgi:hypothetical protein